MTKTLSGSALKMIAMLTMLVDHAANYILRYQEDFTEPLYTFHDKAISWYFLLRCVGRLAFPIFAFLLVEGFIHTRNRRRYGRDLLILALVSEIPWALTHQGFHLMGHNVMFTLFAGFLGLCFIEKYRNSHRQLAWRLLGLVALLILFRPDYQAAGFAFIILLYTLRHHRLLQAVVGSFMLPMEWLAGLAFIPINMYNGKRGFIKGKKAKYLFYTFYPAHLLVIYILKQTMLT